MDNTTKTILETPGHRVIVGRDLFQHSEEPGLLDVLDRRFRSVGRVRRVDSTVRYDDVVRRVHRRELVRTERMDSR